MPKPWVRKETFSVNIPAIKIINYRLIHKANESWEVTTKKQASVIISPTHSKVVKNDIFYTVIVYMQIYRRTQLFHIGQISWSPEQYV